MYIMIVSDAPALPVDICIASAMLGHAAWAFRPEELGVLSGSRPSLVLLDLARPADVICAVAQVRDRYREVPVAILGPDGIPGAEGFFRLDKPVTADALREVMRQATAVAA